MKLQYAWSTAAIAAIIISALTLNFGSANAGEKGRGHAERTPKIDWATLPVGVATSIATLSPDAQTKITAIESKLKSDTVSARASASKADGAVQVRNLDKQANADVMAVLTPDQVTAIEADAPVIDLLKTTIGFKPDALDQLTLTGDQLDKLKALATDHDAKQQAIDDEAKAKTEDLKTTTKTAASAVFTPEQAALLNEQEGHLRRGHVKRVKATN